MRISATIIVILISTYIVSASVLDPVIENVVHLQASKPPKGIGGMWKKKTIWKPRWIKEWKSAKVMKPVWRKIWSPVQIKEWVPIPKPPPGWDSISTPLSVVHPKQKTQVQDLAGYGSFSVQATSNIPLWDPVPYPESQQPPPPPPDSAHSATFNEEQISGIIGARYNENTPEFSETVNHLTRLPVGNNWRPPHPVPNFQNLPGLAEFLIPPQYQTLPGNTRLQEQTPPVEVQPSYGKWIPLPPLNKPKDPPHKFQTPETIRNATSKPPPAVVKETPKNNKEGLPHHTNGDFIQEAQLVGEYHYSEFGLTKKLQQTAPIVDKEQEVPKTEVQTQPEVKTTPKPYPVFENPNLFFIPPNHRFAPVDKPRNETSTKLQPVAPTQPENKNSNPQIVYPTAPQTAPDALFKTYNYNTTTTPIQTTTDKPSTPFSIVFPSSSGDDVTKSPVYIVTPAKTDSS